MFGWVGELADAFAKAGFEGIVVLALLIICGLLIRSNSVKANHLVTMHQNTLEGLKHSSDSHLAVAKVLGRIEGILGLPAEPYDDDC